MKRVIIFLFLSTFLNGFSQSWLPINHDTLLNRKHEFINFENIISINKELLNFYLDIKHNKLL